MAGLFFEVFLLIAAMAVAIMLFSFWKKKMVLLPIPVILFLLSGGLLLSVGLQYESGAVFDSATGIITYSFSTVLANQDLSILLTGLAFIGIGVTLAIMFVKLFAMGGE